MHQHQDKILVIFYFLVPLIFTRLFLMLYSVLVLAVTNVMIRITSFNTETQKEAVVEAEVTFLSLFPSLHLIYYLSGCSPLLVSGYC
jgi:hypothetical protein